MTIVTIITVIMVTLIVSAMISIILIRFFFFYPNPPYRRVVDYTQTDQGTDVLLECGHRILLAVHRRGAFACEQCQEAEDKRV